MKQQITRRNLLKATAVVGLFPGIMLGSMSIENTGLTATDL